ncbi:hypothetical protein [Streptomyces sp. NPDC053427]
MSIDNKLRLLISGAARSVAVAENARTTRAFEDVRNDSDAASALQLTLGD